MVLEVPDCSPSFENFDYTTIWEEHITYFTPRSFKTAINRAGFEFLEFCSYPYSYENSLVGILKFTPKVADTDLDVSEDMRIGAAFSHNFKAEKRRANTFFERYVAQNGKIAIFGAGHLSAAYVNFMDVGRHLKFVVDDHPKKQGLYLPGSKLEIRGSKALLTEKIRLCLLTLSPESEEKVINSGRDFTNSGGRFASVLKGSKYVLKYEN